ncbi:MAG: GTPase Era [Gemmatimonadaceae bacterium]|nr:GTPase Era [Gemmatimonadaceae bacterium]
MTRAGIVTVAGKPNAGKSTLLNRLVGQYLAITSPKAQSTRDRIVGLRSEGDVQMVVLDTPGLLEPKHHLHRSMRGAALAALREADVIVHLIDATGDAVAPLAEVAGLDAAPKAPVLLALNKCDLVNEVVRRDLARAHPGAVLLSARTGHGMPALVAAIAAQLPESPFLYPEDDLSTQHLRFFAREAVREAALAQLDEEVPHAVACEIEEFRETSTPVYIRAVLHVERDSQKGILIGSGGQRIKAIGAAARKRIETLVGGAVYLDLHVKVLANWRRNPAALARLGYTLPPDDKK